MKKKLIFSKEDLIRITEELINNYWPGHKVKIVNNLLILEEYLSDQINELSEVNIAPKEPDEIGVSPLPQEESAQIIASFMNEIFLRKTE